MIKRCEVVSEILGLMKKAEEKDYEIDYIVITPEMVDCLRTSSFLTSSHVLKSTIPNEIGRIFGVRIVVGNCISDITWDEIEKEQYEIEKWFKMFEAYINVEEMGARCKLK